MKTIDRTAVAGVRIKTINQVNKPKAAKAASIKTTFIQVGYDLNQFLVFINLVLTLEKNDSL